MARSFSRSSRHSFFATVALLLLAVGPIALASQGDDSSKAKKKKNPKSAPSASASATDTATTTPAEETPPTATAPSAEPAPTETTTPPEATAAPPPADVEGDITDVREDPTKTYYFVGLRYRGTIVPQFIENLFVDNGGTFYSNTFGGEVDIRKDNASWILWLTYTDYSFGNTLFFQKGQTDVPQNYSIVSSSLKGIYIGADRLWSVPIVPHLDFEGGVTFGLGAIFGTLYNSWVYQDPNNGTTPGAIRGSNGNYYVPCTGISTGVESDGTMPCNTTGHAGSKVPKLYPYGEPNWFNGGSVPVIFPHVGGQVGLRWKPIKQIVARVSLGIELTGFFFGISADYGLENTEKKDTSPALPPGNAPASPVNSGSAQN